MAVPIFERTLRVSEIFRSIQGESSWAGWPCVFVRLTGCPLRCVWCDTEYSFQGGKQMRIGEIIEQVRSFETRLVEITGGEPLAQLHCGALARALDEAGCTVLVETSGALPIDVLPDTAHVIMDLKCPDSGMCSKNDWANIAKLRADRDEVKFVIASRGDYVWSRETVAKHALDTRCRCVLFSAVQGRVAPRDLAAWILEDNLPVRMQLQLHKYIWPPDMKGV